MPTYHYRCVSCGHEFDQFQKFSDDPLTECPECHQAIKRVIGNVGVVFKGSGWYITDSRKSSEKPAADKPAAATAKSDGSESTTKSDTKAEPKTQSKSGSKSESKAAAAV